MTDEKEILKAIVINEKDVNANLKEIIEKASKHFRIESSTGRLVFQNFGSLNDKQRICAVLMGKYFAKKLDLVKSDSLSISEIAAELGKPMTTLSWALKDLQSKGYIEKLPDRKYRISYHRLNEVLSIFSKGHNDEKH
jgi:DNA-binding transcriptional ArsR family regulator